MKGIFLVVLLFTLSFSFVPEVIAADPAGLVTCTDTDCNFCTFIQMVNVIIDWSFGILVLLAVMMMVFAGIKLVVSAGNPSAMTAAKGMVANIVIGFVIILAAWLIVDTMLIALTGGKGFGMWTELECAVPARSAQQTDDEEGENPPVAASGTYTDQEARTALEAAGIGVNATQPQTSLQGMNQATVNEAIRLRQACGCEVMVTGGTEGGHSTAGTYNHGSGYKIDLRVNDPLNRYISTNYTAAGTRSDGARLYRNGSIEYALEGNHWDITVK